MVKLRVQWGNLVIILFVSLSLVTITFFILNEYLLATRSVKQITKSRADCFQLRDAINKKQQQERVESTAFIKKNVKEEEIDEVAWIPSESQILVQMNSTAKFRNRTETPVFSPSELLNPLMSMYEAQQRKSHLSPEVNRQFKSPQIENYENPLKEGFAGNCKELDKLCKRDDFPKITLGQEESYLYLNQRRAIKVAYKYFERKEKSLQFQTINPLHAVINRDPRNYGNSDIAFEEEKEVLYKLLRMQGWQAIPKLFAACLMTKNNTEINLAHLSNASVHYIRYVIEDHAQSTPLCRHLESDEDCKSFRSLRSVLKSLPQPAFTALNIMKSFGLVFENFYINGVYPAELKLNNIVLIGNSNIMFTRVHQLMFMDDNSEEESKYKRLLSGVSCRMWFQCPTRDLYGDNDDTKLCQEFRGHCDDSNRCWGLDAKSYLCSLANTLFLFLNEIVESSWNQVSTMDAILTCSAQRLPEYRCDWTTFKNGIEGILQKFKS